VSRIFGFSGENQQLKDTRGGVTPRIRATALLILIALVLGRGFGKADQ